VATFAYSHIIRFLGNGDNASFFGAAPISGTLNHGDTDATFEEGDTVTGGFRFPGERYLGITVINGKTWPVFYDESFREPFVDMTEEPILSADDDPFVIPGRLPPRQVNENAVFCFAAGTRVATPKGDVAVEAVAIGDLVLTEDGRAVPVKWVGRQTRAPRFQRLRLIRVAAGALGGGLPARDLVLTADHALMLDGLLVNAGALVNGSSITEVANLPERFTVSHIETEDHDIILAEGTPAETFIGYAGWQAFDNYADYTALYGEDRAFAENPAPRITSTRMLPPSLRARLGICRAA
jgi:hypothetical protein